MNKKLLTMVTTGAIAISNMNFAFAEGFMATPDDSEFPIFVDGGIIPGYGVSKGEKPIFEKIPNAHIPEIEMLMEEFDDEAVEMGDDIVDDVLSGEEYEEIEIEDVTDEDEPIDEEIIDEAEMERLEREEHEKELAEKEEDDDEIMDEIEDDVNKPLDIYGDFRDKQIVGIDIRYRNGETIIELESFDEQEKSLKYTGYPKLTEDQEGDVMYRISEELYIDDKDLESEVKGIIDDVLKGVKDEDPAENIPDEKEEVKKSNNKEVVSNESNSNTNVSNNTAGAISQDKEVEHQVVTNAGDTKVDEDKVVKELDEPQGKGNSSNPKTGDMGIIGSIAGMVTAVGGIIFARKKL